MRYPLCRDAQGRAERFLGAAARAAFVRSQILPPPAIIRKSEISNSRFQMRVQITGTTPMQTVVHVTHEAIQKIGGIGAVLQGLFTSRVYLNDVHRNILVGPYWPTDAYGEQRIGPQGEVLYSSLDNIFRTPLVNRFREIESHYNVSIIYGRRRYVDKASGVISTPEVLLID